MNNINNPRIYSVIENVIEYLLKNHREQPDLATLAKIAHMSPTHFQKIFRHWVGISPKQFVQYLNLQTAKQALNNQQSVLSTSEQIGLSSSSRLHDLFIHIEAMTPAEYKNKGNELNIIYGFYETLFGWVILAETHRGTCYLHFLEHHDKAKEVAIENLRAYYPNANIMLGKPKSTRYLGDMGFGNVKQEITIHAPCSHFQLNVWRALLEIPSGETRHYGDIAKTINRPNAARAVGNAIAKNPIAYLIPCHRVIPSATSWGNTGQYRWGAERKKALICVENIGC